MLHCGGWRLLMQLCSGKYLELCYATPIVRNSATTLETKITRKVKRVSRGNSKGLF